MAEKALNLYQRMLVAMDEVRYVQKQKSKDGELKFSVVSHDAVTAHCREALRKAGVYAYPEILNHEMSEFKAMRGGKYGQPGEEVAYVAMTIHISMNFVNADNPEERLCVPMVGVGVDRQAQQDKCPGKAVSYAVKYAYLKALALETGDDPDFEQTRGEESPADESKPDEDRAKQEAESTVPRAQVINDGTPRGMFNVAAQEIGKATGIKYPTMKAKAWKKVREHFGYDSLDSLTIEQAAEVCLFMWAEFAPEHAPEGSDNANKSA